MFCRRLRYENTFLSVKDEPIRKRGCSEPPRLGDHILDPEMVELEEDTKAYVNLLEDTVTRSDTPVAPLPDAQEVRLDGQKSFGQKSVGTASPGHAEVCHSPCWGSPKHAPAGDHVFKLNRKERELLQILPEADLLSYVIQHLHRRAALANLYPHARSVLRLLELRLAKLPVLPKPTGVQPNLAILQKTIQKMTFMRLLDLLPQQCQDAEITSATSALRETFILQGLGKECAAVV
mmetsp:Transcript_32520/g.75180  ORF Transcript_32520/g.75180 Transcript_32520/m.75180 type:complete len:235 (+) Transcript_32520:47-751(+)